MFIVEDYRSKWTKRSWVLTVLFYVFLFHFAALTMHVRYNPFLSSKKKP